VEHRATADRFRGAQGDDRPIPRQVVLLLDLLVGADDVAYLDPELRLDLWLRDDVHHDCAALLNTDPVCTAFLKCVDEGTHRTPLTASGLLHRHTNAQLEDESRVVAGLFPAGHQTAMRHRPTRRASPSLANHWLGFVNVVIYEC
jgi:hypothetical protein